jgi:branched-chain amino acid transport system permease protein
MDVFLQALVDAVLLGGIYTLMVIGLSMSLGITRVINFTHGEAIMLGAYAAYWGLVKLNVDPLIALPLVTLLGAVAGFALFKAVIAPVLDAPQENQILLTFGLGLVFQNIAVILWTGNERSANPSYALSSFDIGEISISGGRLIGFAAAVVVVIGLFLWLKFGEWGRASRALAENRDAAVLMGINVPFLYAFSFGVASALAALTGVICSFIFAITPFMGFDMLVKSFAIIILGGMGSILGSVAGAFLLAFAETMVAYYVPSGNGWAEAVAFGVMFVTLVLRPRGILGHVTGH